MMLADIGVVGGIVIAGVIIAGLVFLVVQVKKRGIVEWLRGFFGKSK